MKTFRIFPSHLCGICSVYSVPIIDYYVYRIGILEISAAYVQCCGVPYLQTLVIVLLRLLQREHFVVTNK